MGKYPSREHLLRMLDNIGHYYKTSQPLSILTQFSQRTWSLMIVCRVTKGVGGKDAGVTLQDFESGVGAFRSASGFMVLTVFLSFAGNYPRRK